MKTMLLIAVLLFSGISQAKTFCLCEIGNTSKFQNSFFKKGCNIWLNRQRSCDSKEVISPKYYQSLLNFLPDLKAGDEVKLSYVGHWASSLSTTGYIERKLIPLLESMPLKIQYENTACNPMDDPIRVQSQLNELNLLEGSSLRVKGSQTLSIGIWDYFSAGENNFYAYADSSWTSPRFPPCTQYENKRCSKKFQSGESGTCYDTEVKVLKELTCSSGKNGTRWR